MKTLLADDHELLRETLAAVMGQIWPASHSSRHGSQRRLGLPSLRTADSRRGGFIEARPCMAARLTGRRQFISRFLLPGGGPSRGGVSDDGNPPAVDALAGTGWSLGPCPRRTVEAFCPNSNFFDSWLTVGAALMSFASA
jgi:hypothetical protein